MANRDSVIDHDDLSQQVSKDPSRPNAIQEVSEPSSPRSSSPSRTLPSRSALTEMMRNSPPTVVESYATGDGETLCNGGIQPVTVGEGIISQPSEQTALLLKRTAYGLHQSHVYGTVKDLESQRAASKKPGDRLEDAWTKGKAYGDRIIRKLTSPKSWNRQEIWRKGIRRPASYVPPVVVGLLLNILDALSYGEIERRSSPMQLTLSRNDLVPSWPACFCQPWARWDIHVLCQLYRVSIGLLSWW